MNKINSIIDTNALPSAVQSIEILVENIIEKIGIADLQTQVNYSGQEISYDIGLIPTEKLSFPILGTGFKFLLNPSFDGSDLSMLPLHLTIIRPINAYVKHLNLENIGRDGLALAKIFQEILQVDDVRLILSAVKLFSSPSKIDQFVTDVHLKSNITLPYDPSISSGQNLLAIIDYIHNNLNENTIQIIISTYFTGTSAEIFSKAETFIYFLLYQQTPENARLTKPLEFLIDLCIPKFTGFIGITPALEIPRKIFTPVRSDGSIETDQNIKATLLFGTITLFFSSDEGLGIDKNISLSLPPSHPFLEIGKSGFRISFSQIKLDLSRKRNIPEADADGRPTDFIGAYITKAEITLPPKWFKNQSTTLGIFARNLLVGTGGISGKLGLEVLAIPGTKPTNKEEMTFVLGKKGSDATDTRKGFAIGFSKFEMEFQQNQIIHSEVKGSLTIPKFRKKGETDASKPLKINIDAYFAQNGDFSITLDPEKDLSIELPGVFFLNIDKMEIGRDEDKVYLQLTGGLDFSNNNLLGKFIDEPLLIKKFRIYSDGSFEIEGGTIPLPDSVRMKVKPVEIYITAIHMGAHEQMHGNVLRKYRYIGLDAGISVNPGGVKAEGDGMKYYFTVDDGSFHSFLRIEGLSIDLTIPGNATPESATLLLKGYLNMKEDEYIGGIKFSLPKAKIAGGADMRYKPSVPAFLIDVNLELPNALPLGNTGMGIYGFRGLFGLRYIAAKDAVTPEAANWFEYYKAPPAKGIRVQKFKAPEKTVGSPTPFSIGAGISLATLTDDGKSFSSQLFLLISIPNLILFEGRANVLGKRLGIEDSSEPPFYAMIAYSPGDSIITGMGVNYNIPREGDPAKIGGILKLNAEVEAAYFFKDSKAWYVNFGTKNKPINAEILSIFNGYSYLMLSAYGIEAGAGVHFSFAKNYCGGVVRANAEAYFDVWGRVIFPRTVVGGKEPTQFGGGIAVGGSVDVSLFGIGFYLGISTILAGEAPKPMRVAGSVELTVAVKLLVKKIEKTFVVEFVWEKETLQDRAPIYALPEVGEKPALPVGAVNLKSGKTYPIQYFGTTKPLDSQITAKIPINAAVDLQFDKPIYVNANENPDVIAKIGGYVNGPEGYEDVVPPAKGNRQVTHRYRIVGFSLKVLEDNGTWGDYHPYKAMTNLPGVENYKIGYWQKTGNEYNKIRLLAQTPFAYMQQGQKEWYTPEQFGLTPAVLLCQNKEREWHCAQWEREGKNWKPNVLYPYKEMSFLATIHPVNTGQVLINATQQQFGLQVQAPGTLELFLPEAAVQAKVQVLASFPYQITITWLAEIKDAKGAITGYSIVSKESKTSKALPDWFYYNDPNKPINKAIITPSTGDLAKIQQLEAAIKDIEEQILIDPAGSGAMELPRSLAVMKGTLLVEKGKSCYFGLTDSEKNWIKLYLNFAQRQLSECLDKQKGLLETIRENCIKGKPSLKCEAARAAAAENQLLCEQLQLNVNVGQDMANNWPVTDKPAQCFYWVKGLCWLTERDHFYNQNIPGTTAIEADYKAMKDAISAIISPVWRPGRKYLAKVDVLDEVDGSKSTAKSYWFGFESVQPFEGVQERTKEQKKSDIASYPTSQLDYAQKKAEADLYRDDDGPELSLKYYIDQDNSYPRADGRLVYAKPLYYQLNTYIQGTKPKPSIILAFKDAQAHHFFHEWTNSANAKAETYEMEILIKDPTETAEVTNSNPIEKPVIEVKDLPSAKLEPTLGANEPLPADAQMLNDILTAYPNCKPISGGQLEAPAQKFLTIQTDFLKPDKLYNVVINVKQTNITNGWKREVHRYNFRTSRYKDLKEHIESYQQKGEEGGIKDAVFTINCTLTNTEKIQMIAIGSGGTIGNPELEKTYHDPVDRIVYGILKQTALPAAICTEFNFIKDQNNAVVGLWIRSPEAFNDPKLPMAELLKTIELISGGSPILAIRKVFSKDRAQIFLMAPVVSWAFPTTNLALKFTYRLHNPVSNTYQEKDSKTTDIITVP